MAGAGGGGAAEDIVRRVLVIGNQRGLHARAAAMFVKTASAFDAEIVVQRDGARVSGLSIMGLMMLAASQGCEIELIASGPEASRAVEAIAGLVSAKFEED